MELGSEYNLDISRLIVSEYNIYDYLSDYNCVFFDSGRSALKALLNTISENEGTVLMPEYICESVIKCFEGNIQFYKIKSNFDIDIEDFKSKAKGKISIIYLMHYYGHIQPDDILSTVKEISSDNNAVIIEDTTHSIFSKASTIGDYMISSIRKWMPVPGAGVLYSKSNDISCVEKYYNYSTDNRKAVGMMLKNAYLFDGIECNTEYRKIFSECEHKLDEKTDIYLANDFSKYIMSCIDINEIRDIRKRNYNYLKNKVMNAEYASAIELKDDEVPFSYIIRSNSRDRLRNYLIDNKIYCAVHWPNDGIRIDERKQFLDNSSNCLSLPIDQRYNNESMDYLYRVLKAYKE